MQAEKATDYPLSKRKMQELITNKEARRRVNALDSVWKAGKLLPFRAENDLLRQCILHLKRMQHRMCEAGPLIFPIPVQRKSIPDYPSNDDPFGLVTHSI